MIEDKNESISDRIRMMKANGASSKGKQPDVKGDADAGGDAEGDVDGGADQTEAPDNSCPVMQENEEFFNPNHICVNL